MKVSVVVILFNLVISGVHDAETANFCGINHERLKRQVDDRWIWGVEDTAATATTEKNKNEPEDQNPCERKPIEMPDFRAPGRRISEQKCYEYIWNIKFRISEAARIQECIAWNLAHPRPNGPHFAIGGREAKPGEFPHMGAIGWKAVVGTWIFKCGSTLISDKFVLTAAHCTKASESDTTIADTVPKIIRFGDKNIIDKFSNGLLPLDQKITRIIVHPQYKSPKKYFDIALMEFKGTYFTRQFDYNYQPACLWSNFDTSSLGTEATLTGWGVIESGGREISPELQAAVVDVVDSKTCDDLLKIYCNRLWCGVQDTQICAGKMAGGVDSCQGDSGGPLQVRINLPPSQEGAMHYVIGVTSFGFGCALPNTPGTTTGLHESLIILGLDRKNCLDRITKISISNLPCG